MNIGIVTTWFDRGAAQVSKQYMDVLQENNDVFIYARGGEKYAKNNPKWDLKNVKWGTKSFFSLNGTPIQKKDFKKWIDKNDIEVIFFNEQQWWPPIIWAKKWGIKIGSYIDYYTKETVPFFEIFDFLICNTERHFSVFKWHKSCHLVKWGTDTNLFSPKQKSFDNYITFFNSAGYNPDRKGAGELIKAFYELNSDKAKLVVHSQVDLKKYYPELSDIIGKLIKNERLEIIVKTVSPPGLYHLGDVYCYISKLDGIGLTVPEALSCGLPVITPDHPPMNEFVKESKNGKLVKIDNTYFRKDNYYWPQLKVNQKSLIDALKFYVENFEDLSSFKKEAREYAKVNLKWSDRTNELNQIFQKAKIHNNFKIINNIRFYSIKNLIKNIYRMPIFLINNIKR